MTVDGQAVGTRVPAPDGSVTVVVTMNSATTATVDDGAFPVNVNINCGANTVEAVGDLFIPGANFTRTVDGVLTVTCSGSGPPTTKGLLPVTGANELKPAMAGLLIVSIGGALVVSQRRRRLGHRTSP